jgi:hypothetical protein
VSDTTDKAMHVVEFFGDGEHRLELPLPIMRELETKLASGPMEVFNRIRSGTFRADDIRETIRLGLVGGGATPSVAGRLVGTYFDKAPIAEYAPIALDVLLAALYGVDPAPAETEAA